MFNNGNKGLRSLQTQERDIPGHAAYYSLATIARPQDSVAKLWCSPYDPPPALPFHPFYLQYDIIY